MDKQVKKKRPPIVTLLGHVDHGKTTLLDYIRKTRVVNKEAGGITQSIGASQITTKEGKKITFIDTPGHAAFKQMRSRGAKVADIAILVVAIDDGVKPQTQEALTYIRESESPFIIAITKTDISSADLEPALGQLEKEGVLLEKRGGNVPWTSLSAKTGKDVDSLLELILLVAEVNEIEGDPDDNLEAVVIETTKSKGGPLVNAIIKKGRIKVGELIYTQEGEVKVKSLISEKDRVKEALPGEPIQILGFENLPEVGTKIFSTALNKKLDKKDETRKKTVQKDQIGVLIKAKNTGSLEAILLGIPEKIVVVDSGIGDIFESDVLLAKASNVNKILAFETKASLPVSKLADAEGVEIHTFKIIYELFQKLEDFIKESEVVELGEAEIVASFPFNNKKIAGCKMLKGKISLKDKLILRRDEKEIGEVRIVSLKKQKQEIDEVKQGEEFGVLFKPQLDFEKGDVLISVAK